ncbi:hypothetical protein N6H14_25610 [Paenibacillus sp. CC-CFT747]|nr:hypothetical protein N6H14_25610 [Paenibacillus sp. CC-CFT747]
MTINRTQEMIPLNSSMVEAVQDLVKLQDGRLSEYREKRQATAAEGRTPDPLGLGTVSIMLPLYAHPDSAYYRDASLLPEMEEGAENFLKTQLPSGCISLVNCNIDSPPDTAFTTHLTSLLYQVAERSGLPELQGVQGALRLFLERAKPCLLNGGFILRTTAGSWRVRLPKCTRYLKRMLSATGLFNFSTRALT